jgi:putative tryptophan/tyrosine transport system substrate-binding protein
VVAIGSKADIAFCNAHVCFWPKADIHPLQASKLSLQYAAFRQELQRLGWIEGQNVHVDVRFGEGNLAPIRKQAAELVSLSPDVILTTGGSATELALQATRTVPIVFAIVPDPVGSGFVESLAEPGGNATGFMQFEYSLSAKWPELLKEIAPNLKRVAVIWDPSITAGIGQFAVIQSVAPSIGIDVRPISVHGDIERVIAGFAHVPNGGLVVTASAATATVARRELIITLAARHKLPAVYNNRFFVTGGGLISYGPDFIDQYRRAAGYVDRILEGEKPADLPVQAPNKYELVINLKAAKALGLTAPPTLLARASEVIE